jgi:uncharacterized membrane protein
MQSRKGGKEMKKMFGLIVWFAAAFFLVRFAMNGFSVEGLEARSMVDAMLRGIFVMGGVAVLALTIAFFCAPPWQ